MVPGDLLRLEAEEVVDSEWVSVSNMCSKGPEGNVPRDYLQSLAYEEALQYAAQKGIKLK